jgi:hypothetical protein
VWFDPDRLVESLVFLLLLLLLLLLYIIIIGAKTAKNSTPTPDARYTDYIELGCKVVSQPFSRKFFSRVIITIIIIIVKSKTATPDARYTDYIGLCGCVG